MRRPLNAVDQEKTRMTRMFYENLNGEMQEVYGGREEPEVGVAIGDQGVSR